MLTNSDSHRFVKAAAESQTDDCLIWTFNTTEFGHPIMWYQRRRTRPSRLVHELAGLGKPPKNLHFRPTCGNQDCINPRHLNFGAKTVSTLEADQKKEKRAADKLAKQEAREAARKEKAAAEKAAAIAAEKALQNAAIEDAASYWIKEDAMRAKREAARLAYAAEMERAKRAAIEILKEEKARAAAKHAKFIAKHQKAAWA